MSAGLIVSLSVYLSDYLYVCMCVCLFVYLSVCLSDLVMNCELVRHVLTGNAVTT